jgi:hypothetical protein
MIKLKDILTEDINEYSEEERAQMGIPSGAESRGGKWYVGDKYAGKIVNGKFEPATAPSAPKAAPSAPQATGTKPPPEGLPDDAFNINVGGLDTWYDRSGGLLGRSNDRGQFRPAGDAEKRAHAQKMKKWASVPSDAPMDTRPPKSDDDYDAPFE